LVDTAHEEINSSGQGPYFDKVFSRLPQKIRKGISTL
jgi:hypothetical protein